MSRNPKPTTEELKFIYQMILNADDDSDILAEYARLYDAGQLMFPYRVDKRFIRERRRELQAASEILQEYVKKKVDPVITKRMDDHFSDLASIAKALLMNGLDSVSSPGWTTNRSQQVKYVIPNANAASQYDELTKEQLTSLLNNNIAAITKDKDWLFRHCFIPHLKSELPGELRTKLFFEIIEEQPYKLIETLRVLAAKKTFKGTCPACPGLIS